MTEEDALVRVHEIGTAFDNDYNDGDGPDYEGCVVDIKDDGRAFLEYSGTTDGVTETFRWRLERVED